MAEWLVTAALLWMICMLAYGEFTSPSRVIRIGDTVKIQARRHVYVTGRVTRRWFEGGSAYVEVAAKDGERYIRPEDAVEVA